MADRGRRKLLRGQAALIGAVVLALTPGVANAARAPAAAPPPAFEIESLNGSANNVAHPWWGEVGQRYQRLAPARYADGVGAMEPGPNPRYVSNRIFNSLGVDLFSEHNVSQWGWVWGQFLDHTFGLAESGADDASIPFDSSDPLERFRDDLGAIPVTRNAVAPGSATGPGNPRQQVNSVSSYIDAWSIYGGTQERLDWLRSGPDNGKPGATLLLPGGYLPRADARGNWQTAPQMQVNGGLLSDPGQAVVSGDVRANENAELTAVHTLLAREHNRIVSALPRSLTAEQKFQIARRVVAAEQQYITYTQFLPAMGVKLAPYRGYNPNVDPELYDEFATIAYRAHSMVNGEEHVVVERSRYTRSQLEALARLGIGISSLPGSRRVELTISQNAAYFDPDVVPDVGLGPLLTGLADEPGYNNDEQVDDALRSVLFEVPGPGVSNPQACYEDPTTPGCFQGVVDLAAIDIQRSRDNGMPTYNQLRVALGLPPRHSFAAVTGESTQDLPHNLTINSPDILDFTSLSDLYGHAVASGANARAVYGTRRATLAARLKAIYGSVEELDAFVGMMSEPHVPGTEFGELQLALWRKQFEALRDGDRFFYLNDPLLQQIQRRYGISYRHTLAELISLDAGVPRSSLPANVFFAPPPEQATPLPPG